MSNFFKDLFNKLFPPILREAPNKGNGLIQSPIDYRDIKMSSLGAVSTDINPTPPSLQIPYKLTIKNQGSAPECAAFTASTMREFLARRKGESIEFDPHWIYKQAKRIDGIPDFPGTYFRAVLSVMKNVGALPVGADPNNNALIASYRIDGYVQVDCTPEAIKRAIFEHGAILLGFQMTNQGWVNAIVRAPKAGEKVFGHATTGIGFEVTFISGQNNWGANWGLNGLFQFLTDYMPFECWAIISDLPENWADLLPPKPQIKHVFNTDLFQGISNDEVKILQDCLVSLGCMLQEQVNSGYGIFGPATRNAVILFQGRYGITQNGRVGPMTRAKLNELFQ